MLARAAHELPPPRLQALRTTGLLSVLFAVVATALGTFLVVLLVPASEQALWVNAPLAGLAQHLSGPPSAADADGRRAGGCRGAGAGPGDSHRRSATPNKCSTDRPPTARCRSALASLHTRFGTPTRAVDVTVVAMILVVLASGGRVSWLARAYGIAIVVMLVLTIAALARLRRSRPGTMPFEVPVNVRVGGRKIPAGLLVSAAVLVAWHTGDDSERRRPVDRRRDPHHRPVAVVHRPPRGTRRRRAQCRRHARSTCCSLPSCRSIRSRPVPATCSCRSAIRTARPRRRGASDARRSRRRRHDGEAARRRRQRRERRQATPTPYERRLLSDVVALAERVGRPVRLLIVPTRNVFDAIVGTVVRLRSSDVYVGESSTLSAEDQARLLGEAWERADKPEAARCPTRHLSPQRTHRHLSPRRPSALSHFRRSRSDSPPVARRRQERSVHTCITTTSSEQR